ADILVDDAAVIADRFGHDRQIVVHHLDETLRRHPFAQCAESLHVAEHHGHDAALALDLGERRAVDQALDNLRVDVAAECRPDELIPTQLLDHAIERYGKLADLISRRDVDRAIETTGFDFAGPFQQPPNRTRDAAADQEREHQTDDGGEGGHDH